MTGKNKKPLTLQIIYGFFKFIFKSIRFILRIVLITLTMFLDVQTHNKNRPKSRWQMMKETYEKDTEERRLLNEILSDKHRNFPFD